MNLVIAIFLDDFRKLHVVTIARFILVRNKEEMLFIIINLWYIMRHKYDFMGLITKFIILARHMWIFILHKVIGVYK